MDACWWWWGAAVLLGIGELMTGTLYLLIVAAGFSAAGVAAWAGGGVASQLLAAAVLIALTWALSRRLIARRSAVDPPGAGALSLDVGSQVRVAAWQSDRSARVHYRGAVWAARFDPDASQVPAPGMHGILRIEGATLILGPVD